ncbi:TetR/AcrR family transcriptional regulator [Kineosporia sp. J2-2]|uniref:TetR/AcrR family transcriptional regulator n=1 Tax=Kineosporia corallincola TaxID=2835133 RepID=A0ABS5TCE0_9ACTN|nr:TetR/AcrR family transcriptional regulator [Kineosporia corallincola]MBT0768711.1 TetR/AcrR family transcriptional regulator [Kineosporia corallincola]
MSEPRRRGSYAVGRERRERILDAATERFATSGYTSTSMARIAKDVGISTTGLVHHFPTKQHLLLAVADRRFDSAGVVAGPATSADGEQLIRSLQSITRHFLDQPGLIELFVALSAEAADPSSAAHELFAARYERIIDDIAGRFRACARGGSFRADVDYDAIAREVVAVSDGMQLQWVLSGRRTDLAGDSERYLSRLAQALRPSPPPA